LILEVYPYMNQNSNTKNVNDLIKDYYEKTNRTLPMFMRINKLIIRTTDFKRSPVMKILRNQQ
jgi:hypothetical protein